MGKKKKKDKKKKSGKKEFHGDVIESIQGLHFLYERRLDDTFNEFDLTNEQYRVLKILSEAPPEGFSLKEIRLSLPNQTSNATRLVEKLRQKKLLTKKSFRGDKRELRISLTEEGSSVLASAENKIFLVNAELKSALSPKSGKNLLESIDRLSNILT